MVKFDKSGKKYKLSFDKSTCRIKESDGNNNSAFSFESGTIISSSTTMTVSSADFSVAVFLFFVQEKSKSSMNVKVIVFIFCCYYFRVAA